MIRARARPARGSVRSGWLIALALCLAALAAWKPLRSLDRPVSDFNLSLPRRIRRPAPPPIVCVLVDENSWRKAARSSVRAFLADLLERVDRHHPRGVALDVLLRDPADPAESRALASALSRTPSAVAAALDEHPPARWLLPDPLFRGVSQIGHVVIEPDEDGIFRRMSAFKQDAKLSIPALPLVAARWINPGLTPLASSMILPDFSTGPQDLLILPAERLLRDSEAGRRIDGQVVFVGVAAPAEGDRVFLPTLRGRPPVPGVLALASVTASLLRGRGLTELPPAAVGLAVLLAAAAAAVWRRRFGRLGAGSLAAAALGIEALSIGALWGAGLVLPTVTLLGAVGLTALAEQVAESSAIDRQTRRLLADLATQVSGGDALPPLPRGALERLKLLRGLQQAIRQDRDRRRVLLENLEEGVLLWDREGRVLTANAAASRLLGVSLRSGEPTPVLDLFEGPSDGPAAARRRVRIGSRELELQRRPVAAGVILGLARDVTALCELESRRRDMQRLITHELRTPLTSLAGFGQMLERYELDRSEGRHVARLIRAEAERLSRMVATLLDLETLAEERVRREIRNLDLSEIVAGRCDVLRAAAAGRNQELKIEREPSAIPVRGHPDLIARVVDNLVGNAVKYAPEGSVITLRLGTTDHRAVLEVADQGPGIPPEEIPRIFERFYRGRNSSGAGTGLGLALVKETVEWQGGAVQVESGRGRGTVFRVLLPIGAEAPGGAS